MATIKSFTSLEQSKMLTEILPLESADMVSPFRHTKNDEYIPEYVVSRNYVEVYNEMIKLPGMEKKDVCQLIQPVWSLAALLSVLESEIDGEEGETYQLNIEKDGTWWNVWYREQYDEANPIETESTEELIDACVEMIIKLNKLNLL